MKTTWCWLGLTLALLCSTKADAQIPDSVLSLDGTNWLVAADPTNVGKQQEWWKAPQPGAKSVRVPGIIQEVLGEYHGVAWYWHTLQLPVHPQKDGRYILRFWSIDYYMDAWVNGQKIGSHEGADTMVEFDITQACKPGAENVLAVRVINPGNDPVDGFAIRESPGRNKFDPWSPGSSYNGGGITDSVELLLAPLARIESLFLKPNWQTGVIEAEVNVRNAGSNTVTVGLGLTVAPASSGETLAFSNTRAELKPGDTLVKAIAQVQNSQLWSTENPFLYRVTARLGAGDATSLEEKSARCGFRDFRFDHGYFRLNGKRIFLKSAHFGGDVPMTGMAPFDESMVRKDFLSLKMMGFNMARCISGLGRRHVMDLADEIGLLVYDESYAAWCVSPSPHLAERWNQTTAGMIRRDRNHPSVVIWGLLNETVNGPVFAHAVNSLPFVRQLDDTRLVLLNSGRFDGMLFEDNPPAGAKTIGSLSNPGGTTWEDVLADKHPYQPCPHTADVIQALRTISGGGRPLFISEYGFGSANHLLHLLGHYTQAQKGYAFDRQLLDDSFRRFSEDWTRWNLADLFGNMENYFRQCVAMEAEGRLIGTSAIRANTNMVAHSLTACHDTVMAAEGVITSFREPKPGVFDAMWDAWSPLRFCVFAEPIQAVRGGSVQIDAVLVNEDALKAGKYPVRVQVLGPGGFKALDESFEVAIPAVVRNSEPPFAKPVFSRDVKMDGPAGPYKLFVYFEKDAAAEGGEYAFWLNDPATLSDVTSTITLWGKDADLAHWLESNKIKTRSFTADSVANELILVGNKPGDDSKNLTLRIKAGATAIFLSPEVFLEINGEKTNAPLLENLKLVSGRDWLYENNDWAKNHPIFKDLPTGLLGYQFYREILGEKFLSGQPAADEAVSGMINTSLGYNSGLTVGVYRVGNGRVVLNTLLIRENLSSNTFHPIAERLLRNMLNCYRLQ